MKDMVEHPEHYKGNRYECIDVMEDVFGTYMVMSFCILNAFKYIWRHKEKNGDEDIRKAIWYLEKYLELAEKERD